VSLLLGEGVVGFEGVIQWVGSHVLEIGFHR